MTDAVHLTESRCDGSAHGGCENACSLYWKEQWLKRVDPDDPVATDPGRGHRALLPLLVEKAQKEPFEDGEPRYSCQATEMLRATPQLMPRKDLSQYQEDLASGNAGVLAVIRSFLVDVFNRYQDLSKRFLPRFLQIRGGLHWGFLRGRRHQRPYADGAPRPPARSRWNWPNEEGGHPGHKKIAVRETPARLAIGNDAGKSFAWLQRVGLARDYDRGSRHRHQGSGELKRLAHADPLIEEVIPVKRLKRKAYCKVRY